MTYNSADYGTITLFEVETKSRAAATAGASGRIEWPVRISPVAAMTAVPKKLLKKIASSVSKDKKTILGVKTTAKKRPLTWVSYSSNGPPWVGFSPNVDQNAIPSRVQELLAIEADQMDVQGKTAMLSARQSRKCWRGCMLRRRF